MGLIKQRSGSIGLAVIAAMGFANWVAANLPIDQTPIIASTVQQPNVPTRIVTARDEPIRSTAEFTQTTSRPLFFSSRRVPDQPGPSAQPVEIKEIPTQVEPLILIGIKGQGGQRQVLVRASKETVGTWLSVGDEFRGWQLRDVQSDNAILEDRGRRVEIRLYSTKAPENR